MFDVIDVISREYLNNIGLTETDKAVYDAWSRCDKCAESGEDISEALWNLVEKAGEEATDYFKDGFRLGVQLMINVMSGGQNNLWTKMQ